MSDPRVRFWDENFNEIYLSAEERKTLFGLNETEQDEADDE